MKKEKTENLRNRSRHLLEKGLAVVPGKVPTMPRTPTRGENKSSGTIARTKSTLMDRSNYLKGATISYSRMVVDDYSAIF